VYRYVHVQVCTCIGTCIGMYMYRYVHVQVYTCTYMKCTYAYVILNKIQTLCLYNKVMFSGPFTSFVLNLHRWNEELEINNLVPIFQVRNVRLRNSFFFVVDFCSVAGKSIFFEMSFRTVFLIIPGANPATFKFITTYSASVVVGYLERF
jgi:hypothetical protein